MSHCKATTFYLFPAARARKRLCAASKRRYKRGQASPSGVCLRLIAELRTQAGALTQSVLGKGQVSAAIQHERNARGENTVSTVGHKMTEGSSGALQPAARGGSLSSPGMEQPPWEATPSYVSDRGDNAGRLLED